MVVLGLAPNHQALWRPPFCVTPPWETLPHLSVAEAAFPLPCHPGVMLELLVVTTQSTHKASTFLEEGGRGALF